MFRPGFCLPFLLALGATAPASAHDTFLDGVTISDTNPDRADLQVSGHVSFRDHLCVGDGCFTDESFLPQQLLKLKDPNPAIYFEDTSSDSYPNNNWRILANDPLPTVAGGTSFLAFGDLTSGTSPFLIMGGAPSASLNISPSGNIGFGTSMPTADLHVVDGSYPAIRLEQDGSEGYASSQWDISAGVVGNSGGFAIRQWDGVFTAPFLIQSGAPQSAMIIKDNGDVGLGMTSPDAALHMRRDDGSASILVENNDRNAAIRTLLTLKNYGRSELALANTDSGMEWTIGGGTNFALKYGIVGSRSAGKKGYLAIDGTSGDMTIKGQLTTGGPTCDQGCDAVFGADYDLPSIAEHAARMYALGHLPNVGPTTPGQPINVSDRFGRLLNELEHAHIYIATLNRENAAQRTTISALDARLRKIEARLDQ